MTTSTKDQIFNEIRDIISPFEFDQSVADVFDDMLVRSIPFYKEVHRIILDIVNKYYLGDGIIYDLGCSTGTTIQLLYQALKEQQVQARFIGVDNSAPMIEKAQKKLEMIPCGIELATQDITEVPIKNAQIVILNYTLQFLAKDKKASFLQKIYDGLRPGGVLIISEKIHSPHDRIQNLITELYYDFKRNNGYSNLEIAQKKEALENVLLPMSSSEQLHLLTEVGLTQSEMIFRWYNFATYIGIKNA